MELVIDKNTRHFCLVPHDKGGEVSIHENIEIFHPLDVDEYLTVLKKEFNAHEHPAQPNSFLIGEPGLPFYKPKQMEGHVSVLGFNKIPLSDLLLEALIKHPELVSEEAIVRWTQEQELIVETTMGDLRKIAGQENNRSGTQEV